MSAGVLSHQFSRQITVLWKRRKNRSYLLYSIKLIHINHHRLLLWHLSFPSQSCTVRTLVTWSTPPGLYLTPSSWWGRPFSTAAIRASSCRGAPPSLATAGSRGPPCGRLDYLTVFVSVGKSRESFSGQLAWVICFFPAIIAPECQRRRFMCCISFLWLMIYVHPCVHWCVWYVNAMLMHHTNQPSATWRRGWRLSMSHVTSVGARQICQPARLWSKSSDLFWETQQDPVFPFFFLFFCQLRILFPVKTLVSLTTATRSCPRGSTCPGNHSPLSATKGTSSSGRPPLSAFWETRHSGVDHCHSAGVRCLLIYVNCLYNRNKHPVVLATIAFASGLQS